MAKEDKDGRLHSEKDGKFVSKNKPEKEQTRNEKIVKFATLYRAKRISKDIVLTKKEWAMWYNAIGEIKRGMYCPICRGKKYIQIGNKIIVTSGTYTKPNADAVLEFSDNEKINVFI